MAISLGDDNPRFRPDNILKPGPSRAKYIVALNPGDFTEAKRDHKHRSKLGRGRAEADCQLKATKRIHRGSAQDEQAGADEAKGK